MQNALLLCLAIALSSGEIIHVVKPGESLSLIANRYYGSPSEWKRIARENAITNPNSISAGTQLRIFRDTFAVTDVRETRPVMDEERAEDMSLVDGVGFVEVSRGDRTIKLRTGDRIYPGDVVRTARLGRALLSMRGGERLELGEQAIALVCELSATSTDRRISVRIERGTVIFDAPSQGWPSMVRYLIETPTGSINVHSGRIVVAVSPPDQTALSVLAGSATAVVPRGSVEVSAGTGVALSTMELPGRPIPLPSRPGVSIETAGGVIIFAAATQSSHRVAMTVFDDPDFQKQVSERWIQPDKLGVALARVPAASGRYWIRGYAVDSRGLAGEMTFSGPIVID